MKHYFRTGALAVLLGAGVSSAALADSAKTLGGIVVTSDDGNFVGSLGGRIQFDYTGILPDKGVPFDSGDEENDSGFFFRRVYITLTGRFYGWRYRIDEDISNTATPAAGFKYVFVSHDIGEYGTIRIGQSKPWRSVDEMASDLDTPFVERNVLSSSGLLGGRQYDEGLFYRYSRPNLFLANDHFWGGVSGYSLNSAGAVTNEGTGTPTQGLGYNARLVYAPIAKNREWVHVGASFSSDHADNGASLTAYDATWYSDKGVTQTVASFVGSTPNTSAPTTTAPSLANIGGGNNPHVNITEGELAGALGSAYLQGEVGLARFSQATPSAKGVPADQDVFAYAVEGTYYLTGESRRYDTDAASFAKPAPLHNFGAVELALGYNFIKNRDLPAGDTSVCKPSLGSIPSGRTISKCDVSSLTFGANYYINPNVQVMLDYYYGEFNAGNAGKDLPKAVNARFQVNF